jgi:hypothetical protein
MDIKFTITDEVAKRFLEVGEEDFAAVAKQYALVNLYRLKKIFAPELARELGLGRIATEDLLSWHGLPVEDFGSSDDYARAAEEARRAAEDE